MRLLIFLRNLLQMMQMHAFFSTEFRGDWKRIKKRFIEVGNWRPHHHRNLLFDFGQNTMRWTGCPRATKRVSQLGPSPMLEFLIAFFFCWRISKKDCQVYLRAHWLWCSFFNSSDVWSVRFCLTHPLKSLSSCQTSKKLTTMSTLVNLSSLFWTKNSHCTQLNKVGLFLIYTCVYV